MDYLYCENGNFEDFSSGRVLYGGRGIPNFPVRLLREMYGRAKSHLNTDSGLTVYDPCCGGGYALTVLGFFDCENIRKIYGSDIDESMTEHARKNTSLLSRTGLDRRTGEIAQLHREFGKPSHKEALDSCGKLRSMLTREVDAEVFRADCMQPLPGIAPDIIITDVPYGNLVDWNSCETVSIERMLEQLWQISREGTVLAICMDKKQKLNCGSWTRLEKHNVGKRRFEILQRRA